MPIYTVTYCTQDTDVGANLLWHTCFFLSRFDEETKKLEVVETWGFYGVPTTQPDSIARKIKLKLALDVDIWGNHGVLRHEEIRYMDTGAGLHGATFELTEEKFVELQAKCKNMVNRQNRAIGMGEKIGLKPKEPGKFRIYPYENHSARLYELAKVIAEEEGHSPDLKPFSFSILEPHTCKTQALALLDGILEPEQIDRIAGLNEAISRTSGRMETISLHSTGPLRPHTKASGDVVYFRDAEQDTDVKLYWTLPPQEIETLSDETEELFWVHKDYVDEIKQFVKQLQRMEWLIRNAKLDKKYDACRKRLLDLIIVHYEVYSVIKPKPAHHVDDSLSGKFMHIWSKPPKTEYEKNLERKLARTEKLFQLLYQAMNDPEAAETLSADATGTDMLALVALLSPKVKALLDGIINSCIIINEEDSIDELIRAIC